MVSFTEIDLTNYTHIKKPHNAINRSKEYKQICIKSIIECSCTWKFPVRNKDNTSNIYYLMLSLIDSRSLELMISCGMDILTI